MYLQNKFCGYWKGYGFIMIDTRCGLRCEGCAFKESHGCKGCIATNGVPFHGECAVAVCCQEKGLMHCGECEDIPCELLTQYSCDPVHGDDPQGARIEQCKQWRKIQLLLKKAEQLLSETTEVTVASINENGYPRICVLSTLKHDGYHTVYFSTGSISEKVKHFMNNPKASLCYYGNGNSVTLIGDIEIIVDLAVKDEIWQDWMINHFPKGSRDENYCVLKFEAKEATLWIDREFETVKCADYIFKL